jgi:quercetin dioxygenase-like cupin family protein
VAAVGDVSVVSLDDVNPVVLEGGSWSRVLIDSSTVAATGTCFGYSAFAPGTSTRHMSHTVEELAYVVRGEGYLQLDNEKVQLSVGQGCHIPPGIWHSVVNDRVDEALEMVFAFAFSSYPPTEHRDLESEA